MKKDIYSISMWLIVTGFMVSGCSKDNDNPEPTDPVEITLTVSPSSVSFKPEGEIQTISVYSNTDWTITEEGTEQWCKIDKTKGTGDATLILTAEKNPSDKERNYQYTITSIEGKKAMIRLSQPGSDLRVALTFNCQDEVFEAGQSIGLFTVNRPLGSTSVATLGSLTDNQISNAKITKQTDNTWKSSENIFWQSQETTADCYAYYPWREADTKDTPSTWNISINEDQSLSANSNASIYLYGQKLGRVPATNSALDMTFTPVVAQVNFQINLTEDAKSVYELTDVRFAGTKNEATLDLNTGTLTPVGTTNQVKGLMTANTKGGYDVKFILFPQDIKDITGTITYVDKRNNETVTGNIPLEEDFSLEGGKSYTVIITMEKTFEELNVDNISIAGWEKGGDFDFSFH